MSGALRLGLLLGDGIGPEIVPAAAAVADAAAAASGLETIEWTTLPMGIAAIGSHGDALPEETVEALETLDGWLLGPHDSAGYPEPHRTKLNPSGALRKRFDLYANIRPAKSLAGANAIVPGTDLVIVRENTEGFYADRNTFRGSGEMMPTPDVAIMHGIITRERSERIAHEAFRIARTRRNHVSIAHKANVLPMSSGLFLQVCKDVAAGYPEVIVDDFHVDAMAARLVRRADEFDVIVAENMLGDILSDLTGEIAGSLGLAPSINASRTRAMAQAAHGSAPDIAGRGIANPSAMILSTAQLLRWLGERRTEPRLEDAARRIETAVESTIAAGSRTRDLGGSAGTASFTAAVVASIDSATGGAAG